MQLKLLNGNIILIGKDGEKQIKILRGQEFSSWFEDGYGDKHMFLKYRWGKSHNAQCDDCGFFDLKNGVFSIFDGVTNVAGKEPGFGGKQAFELAQSMPMFINLLISCKDFKVAIDGFIKKNGRKKSTAVIVWLDKDKGMFHAFSVGDSKFVIGDIENDDSLIFDEQGSALIFGDEIAHRFYSGPIKAGSTLVMFTDGYLNPEDDLIHVEYEIKY
ncbi:MAG: hypothetical protein QXP22_02530 [Candidatus Anstonellales archaeon]